MEEKVAETERPAPALYSEVATEMAGGQLRGQVPRSRERKSSVEDRLAALKAKVGGDEPADSTEVIGGAPPYAPHLFLPRFAGEV